MIDTCTDKELLQAILDDAASLGQAEKLRGISEAFRQRSIAVSCRLAGKIPEALEAERLSWHFLSWSV